MTKQGAENQNPLCGVQQLWQGSRKVREEVMDGSGGQIGGGVKTGQTGP